MHHRRWKTELVLGDSRMRLCVTLGPQELVRADLPYLGEEQLALRHLLEGLALWQGPPLWLACDVDGRMRAGCATSEALLGVLVPPSPLLRASIGVRVTDREHDGGARCVG